MGGIDGDTGDLDLATVLGSIQAKTVTQRMQGIKDLKTIFDPNRPATNINKLKDNSYHKIYEVVFQAALTQKAEFLSSKPSTRSAAITRLTACADALRLVVKTGAPKLKVKTVEAITDHITQTLPTANNEYCQPLSQHYLKALNIVFEYPPNVERLKKTTWFDVVEFCVDGINQYLHDHDGEPSGPVRSSSGLGTKHLSGSIARSGTPNGHTQSRSGSLSRQNAEDLLHTLFSLVSTTSAPLAGNFHIVMNSIVRFLQTQSTNVSQMHQVAFSVVNAILSYTCTDQISFTQSIAQDIIPLVCRFWQGKTVSKDEMLNSVRDEMLIFLFAVHPHLERSILDDNSDDLLTLLEELADVLKADYAKRSERDQLQLDDLEMVDLGLESRHASPFSLNAFRLRPHNPRAERNWGNLQAIGVIERLISCGHQHRTRAGRKDDQDTEVHPRKRQRVALNSDRLFNSLRSEDEKSRVSALQALPFILQDFQLSVIGLNEVIQQLHSCASDKRGGIASWALLSIASCTFQKASHSINTSHWTGFWHVGARLLTFSGTCRAAALQLHSILAKKLVDYHSISDDVNSMITTADTSGPATICDSAIYLMTHLLNARVTEVPGASLLSSHHTVRWLFTRWNPADRSFAAHYALHVQPLSITNLLRTCLGLHRVSMPSHAILPCGLLAQAWQHHIDSRVVIRYLLLLDEPKSSSTTPCSMCSTHEVTGNVTYVLDSSHFHSTRKLILELLLPKCNELLQSWRTYTVDRLSSLSMETFRSAVYSCVTMLFCMAHFSTASSPQLHEFENGLQDFYKEIIGFLSEAEAKDGTRTFTETLLQCVQPYLPMCGAVEFGQLLKDNSYLVSFLAMVAEDFTKRRILLAPLPSVDVDDPMDMDNEFSTQQSHSRADTQKTIMPRKALAVITSPSSFYLVGYERLTLIHAMSLTPEFTTFVPSIFIDQLLELSDEEFMLSRTLLDELVNSDLAFNIADAARLLERIGFIIESNEFGRCEVALTLCLDLLVGLGHLWSTEAAARSLTTLATSFYEFFYKNLAKEALEKFNISPEVQVGIAKLLFSSLRRPPKLDEELALPSARSNLFDLLKLGPAPVQFNIGNRLPGIFHLFILEHHDDIFVDLLQNLPSDPNSIEGISFRLYVLARLASEWPTLLRRCLYHLFETPGNIPESLRHTTRCLSDVSSALKLKNAQKLFALFAPQLLYTWFGLGEDIQGIPFQIFGFSSLRDLVSVAQEELTGLMMMRGRDGGIQQIASILGIEENELLKHCFTKVMAYTIGFDVATASSKEGNRISGEARVKKRLGRDVFFECVNTHFAAIIALFFNISDPQINVDTHFAKIKDLKYAADILVEIKSTISSTFRLPPNQQPSFKDKHLFAQIERLCSQTEFESGNIYTPALVTFIARKLFDTIHPALGSLHACSVLRKARVLISLAGGAAITGYSLEMLLQAIRPFINDPQCADDALGIIQYLLTHGSEYLSKVPSFVAGISLAILGSLRIFLKAGRASSTQESHHKATVSRVQIFHKWLGTWLDSYNSPRLKSQSRANLRKLLRSAYNTEWMGNAETGTPESEMLMQLLQDEQLIGRLLSKSSRELALNLLCADFQGPTSFRTDVLGDDSTAIANAVLVWKSCRSGSFGKQYLTWAGRVLGRAFAASGHVHEELLRESSLSEIKDLSPASKEQGDSTACILNLLQDLILGYDERNAGLAEAALRIIMTTSDETLRGTCKKTLAEGLYIASMWAPYDPPPSERLELLDTELHGDSYGSEDILREHWLRDLTVALAGSVPDDIVLSALVPIVRKVSRFAEQAFPFILHLVLSSPYQDQHTMRKKLSKTFVSWFGDVPSVDKNKIKVLINSLLYLRTQPLPNEISSADRSHWLHIDYMRAAAAATRCGMFRTALLFAEEYCSAPAKSSRRSSVNHGSFEQSDMPSEMLLAIFQNIDDPDLYYGVKQNASLNTILARSEYEKDGPKALAFRSALYDNHLRRQNSDSNKDAQALVKALHNQGLGGLSHSLFQAQQSVGMNAESLDSMFSTARKLEQWDLPVPSSCNTNAVTTYKAFQSIQTAVDQGAILRAINEGFGSTMSTLMGQNLTASALHDSLQTLAALVEMDEVLSTQGSEQIEEMLSRFQDRSVWMKTGRFDDINQILSCRGTTLSMLSQQPRLQNLLKIDPSDTCLVEVRTALLASTLNRAHHALQASLSLATSLVELIPSCQKVSLNVEIAVQVEAANALWDQGEMDSSIGMLKALDDAVALKRQTVPVGRSHLLSKIGHQVSVARRETADHIIESYLKPALKELKGKTSGSEAGQLFHQFAIFCDEQLQDQDDLEDLERLDNLAKGKREDVMAWEKLVESTKSTTEKERHKQALKKAKAWLKLDEEELQRHISNREQFLGQSLENYMLALAASDEHDNVALRFAALWLEHAEEDLANDAVLKHLKYVPSRKLAPLMNQLSSRLQHSDKRFQQLLFSLIMRICTDHPYHGMYVINAAMNSRPRPEDEAAMSRNKSAQKVSRNLADTDRIASIWQAIQNTNKSYIRLATEKDEQRYKSGKKVAVKDSRAASGLNAQLTQYSVPPPTMSIELAADLDYSRVPVMHKLEPVMSIASGVSTPKIITIIADNGARYKQLVKFLDPEYIKLCANGVKVKGSQDDLRQDAVMEQVFEQVNELLKRSRSTRQRDLNIRTYKVVPLSAVAGIIEFVANTTPLHEYLMPAHEKYYPKDMPGNQCRKEIGAVQTQSVENRIRKFRTVTDRFHPVMRYFFTENFTDPDEWFVKRLAYTRSTAAISILGHVLGLGDRHGHNILLDSQSGEVVHIDLGVAFEAGRILPIPELVPFRLTRDIVDGMGITKTEGVFRRCCEFTLEALRKEVNSIMAILDVLRYDPLYNWSISAVRVAKLQEGQAAAPNANIAERTKEAVNEPGEAKRALTVVNKKLSKTLSVTATVNDLINQAIDERNLAVLYSGWAAYA